MEVPIQNGMQSPLLAKSLEGLSGVIGFIGAVLLTPWLNDLSSGWAMDVFTGIYGSEFAGIFAIGWFLVVAIAAYMAVRALLSIILTMLVSHWIVFRF